MNEDLRQAIAAFVAACARYALVSSLERRMELHTAYHAMTGAWERWAP